MVALNPKYIPGTNYSPIFRSKYERWKETPLIDPESGATIYTVSPHELGPKTLGRYFPTEHVIEFPNNLAGRDFDYVQAHEIAHALGEIDERKTDIVANSRVGHSLRKPF